MEEHEVAEPSSIAEVEALIRRYYEPGPSAGSQSIERQLRQLQKLPDGWQMADKLLASDDVNVRFFGAHTFAVKINSDWGSLEENHIQSLQTLLVTWLVRLIVAHEGALVMQKMCSTLATYFIQPRVPKTPFLRRLVCSLYKREIVSQGLLDRYADTGLLLADLSTSQLLAVLGLSTIFAQEAEKKELGLGAKVAAASREQAEANFEDAVKIMHFALTYRGSGSTRVIKGGFDCYYTWVVYAQRAWPKSSVRLESLRSLIQPALECCAIGPYEDMGEAVDHVAELLSDYPSFWDAEHREAVSALLRSPWGQQRMAELQAEDPTRTSFARLLLAYGDVAVQDIVQDPSRIASQEIMGMMHQLLCLPGYPAEDDVVIGSAIEFWNTFVEFATDSGHATGPNAWLDWAKRHMMQMVQELWIKIRHPPSNIIKAWTDETKRTLDGFRVDVRDLLQSSHVMLGNQLLEGFARIALDTLSRQDWMPVEATLFCLSALADSLNDNAAEDEALLHVFNSSLFPDLSRLDSSIPARTRRTAVDMVGQYGGFFTRHPEVLPAVLNFLFASLQLVQVDGMANAAARAILNLCAICRAVLTPELNAFFQQYEQFLTWPTASVITKPRVIGAVAAIVQALPTDESRAAELQRLLDFVDKDVERSLVCMAAGQVEESQVAGLTALQCLAAMGRSLQVPEEGTIDLDQDDPEPSYWTDGPGSAVQQRIARFMLTVVEILGEDADVVEAACDVFKSGFREIDPGPFVLPPHVTVEFLSRVTLATPRLGVVYSTICGFLASHASDLGRTETTSLIDNEAGVILQHVYGMISTLGSPRDDPEVSQSSLDVLTSFVRWYINVLLRFQPPDALRAILHFGIECLVVQEAPLAKHSASKFWTELAGLQCNSPELQQALDDVIQLFGPSLATALVRGVGGEAVRSDLHAYLDPLKKFITRHPMARNWLETALLGPQFPSNRVNDHEKRRFLEQVVSARGSKATNDIVLEFWVKCHGTVNL